LDAHNEGVDAQNGDVYSVLADSDEEQDPDPDSHLSENGSASK
jgi:hypothetical protein